MSGTTFILGAGAKNDVSERSRAFHAYATGKGELVAR